MSSRPKPLRYGFTLIEMLVVIAIIGILAGILIPVLAGAREKGRQTSCMSNQHQLAVATTMYGSDNERYPDTSWNNALSLDKGVFACPDKPDETLGYGMNSFIHGLKPELISRASDIICTVDSTASSTLSADFTRHNKGAIFSRLDGSCKFAKKVSDAGRFACGKFPIMPIVIANGQQSIEPPMSFVQYTNATAAVKTIEPSTQFIVAGPYGDGAGDGALQMVDKVYKDYIIENTISAVYADDSPEPGDIVPEIRKIESPVNATDTAVTVGKPINEFKKWTIAADLDGSNRVKMEMPRNYNCSFVNRTTYACTYIFSPEDITIPVDWFSDDGGVIWLNGNVVGRTDVVGNADAAVDASHLITGKSGGADGTLLMTIPKGISYLLLKVCNEQGGMKFKLGFKLPAGKTLAFSPSL